MLRAASTGDVSKVLRLPGPTKQSVGGGGRSSKSSSKSNIVTPEPFVLMPELPPALCTRRLAEARREQERTLELQLLNGLDTICIICGEAVASSSGQLEMVLCECHVSDSGVHGVHMCCLVSEPERVQARACCGKPAERALAREYPNAVVGQPFRISGCCRTAHSQR